MDLDSLNNHYCSNPELLNDAYAIRYQAYLQQGYIEANTQQRLEDEFDSMPNNHTFVLKCNQRSIASLRVSVIKQQPGWLDIPVKRLFPEVFTELENKYDTLMELNRLTVLPEITDFSATVPLALFANPMHLTELSGKTLVICAARKNHKRFYERLGFRKITDYKRYPTLKFDTAMFVSEWDPDKDRLGQYPLKAHYSQLKPVLSDTELAQMFR
ncbi:hypothetical protein BIT28_21615 [Photobacterium proteolyticum]|uniref:N-acyl amino acid synthase FeeM catalytic core domain-containing protein n=2 Tax=Photobacterium proteolyticum TaxID=1903952 RepID=A0A1Q9GG76_9GAMM|nr:hypothetical protein BIT28_21615 [Photobacterium proteolyticum]